MEITVRREGRVFVVTAKEAQAGPNQVELQLSGGVKVSVSDGFELVTDHGTFNQNESIARAPGDVTFKKGLMSGSGRNATYNQKSDVLNIAEQREGRRSPTRPARSPSTELRAARRSTACRTCSSWTRTSMFCAARRSSTPRR